MLTIDELRQELQLSLDINGSSDRRAHNVTQFSSIARNTCIFGDSYPTDLIAYVQEFQILYDVTTKGERIYMRGPGKESVRIEKQFPNDFKPVIPEIPGKDEGIKDLSAGAIFKIFAQLFDRHKDLSDILMLVLLQIAYLQCDLVDFDTSIELIKPDEVFAKMMSEGKKKSTLYNHFYEIVDSTDWKMRLYKINFSTDVWNTLNSLFSMNKTDFSCLSFEAYIRYCELVVQNEDCKYDYRCQNQLTNKCKKKGVHIDQDVGRINTSLSALAAKVISSGVLSVEEVEEVFQNANRKGGMRPVPLWAIQKLVGDKLLIVNKETL